MIPWARLLALIEPHYPKAGNGTQPHADGADAAHLLHAAMVQPVGPAAEDSLYDIESMRRFAGIELGEEAIPDETTILRFRHLLEKHQLTEQIFAEIRTLLEEKRLLLKSGTIVDATIIAAPPSTKNAEKARDPEMHQTKKGKQWHFGMKAHVGTDKRGIVHSLATTACQGRRHHPDAQAAAREGAGGLRRPGLLERGAPAGRQSSRHPLPHQPPRHATAIRSPITSATSIAFAPRHGRAASTPSTSSSACGASPRCATAAWPRTPHGCSPPLRWPTCICSDDACCHRRRRVDADRH